MDSFLIRQEKYSSLEMKIFNNDIIRSCNNYNESCNLLVLSMVNSSNSAIHHTSNRRNGNTRSFYDLSFAICGLSNLLRDSRLSYLGQFPFTHTIYINIIYERKFF